MRKSWFTVKGMSPPRLVFLFFLLFGIGYYLLSIYIPFGSWLHSGRGTGSNVELIINLIALPGALICLGLVKLIGLPMAWFGHIPGEAIVVFAWFTAQLLTALLAAWLFRLGQRCFRTRKPPAA